MSEAVNGLVRQAAEAGLTFLLLPEPADGDVARALDASGGLIQASSGDRDSRAWQIDEKVADAVGDGTPDQERSWLRVVLLVVQCAAVVVVVVVALPSAVGATRERGRRR